MCIICRNEYDINTTSLNCSNCPLLTNIPNELIQLTLLYCDNCPLLTHIPKEFNKLTGLRCSNCPLLTHIPNEFNKLAILICSDCHWLKQSYKNNEKLYEKQINNLLIIQRLFKLKYFQKNLSVQTDIIKYIFMGYYL